MERNEPHEPRPARWLAAWAVCTAIGLLTGLRLYLTYRSVGRAVSWLEALTSGLMEWWLWALLFPPLAWLCARFPLRSPGLARALLVHLVGSVALAATHVLLFAAASAGVRSVLYELPFQLDSLALGLVWQLPLGVAIIWAAAFGLTVLDGRRTLDRERLQAALLREELSRARLEVLRLHLQPHFLFNTLNAIAASIHAAPATAERMLTLLGDLLRRVLESSDEREVPLCEELDFLERYVEIERARHGPRLTVRLEADEDTLGAQVPSLLLQPLVENAIRHGIARRPGPGTVIVRSGRRDARLWLEVEDDGAGPPEAAESNGVGLSNTRERLRALHGLEQELHIGPAPSGRGTLVRIELPFSAERAG